MLHQLLWGTIDYQHGWQINLILFQGKGFWLYIGLIFIRAVIWELILRGLTKFRSLRAPRRLSGCRQRLQR